MVPCVSANVQTSPGNDAQPCLSQLLHPSMSRILIPRQQSDMPRFRGHVTILKRDRHCKRSIIRPSRSAIVEGVITGEVCAATVLAV